MGPVEFFRNRQPQFLLCRITHNPFSAQPGGVSGFVTTLVQDIALHFVELHEACTGPPFKPVQVPQDGFPPAWELSLHHVNCTTQLGVIGKYAEGALDSPIHVTNKDGTLNSIHLSRYQPLRDITQHCSVDSYYCYHQ